MQRYPSILVFFQQEVSVEALVSVFSKQKVEDLPFLEPCSSSKSDMLLLVFLPYINALLDQKLGALKIAGIHSSMKSLVQLAYCY